MRAETRQTTNDPLSELYLLLDAAGLRPHRDGNAIDAQCPRHPGLRPELRIWVSDDATLKTYCSGGCSAAESDRTLAELRASNNGEVAKIPAARRGVPVAGNDFNKTELGNAERLVARHGPDLIYLGQKGWMVWDDRRFAKEQSRELDARAVETVRNIYREAADDPVQSTRRAMIAHARNSENRHRIQAMADLARHMLAVKPNAWAPQSID